MKKITSAADLKRDGRAYFVKLHLHGEEVQIPVRHLSVAERERIEDEVPEPYPPRVFRPSGDPYLDTTDQAYRTKLIECQRKRRETRVVRALGKEFFGGDTNKAEQIRILREDMALTPEDVVSIDLQLRSPYELTSDAVATAEERLAPFADTETADS